MEKAQNSCVTSISIEIRDTSPLEGIFMISKNTPSGSSLRLGLDQCVCDTMQDGMWIAEKIMG